MRALAAHLPPPPARILDCGGGPGRYAIELARQGYQVTLFDLSAEALRMARQKAREAGVTLEYARGTATDLSRFPDDAFDVVCLMGPLYHLLDEAERTQALAEAARVLAPGGTLCAAFITRYAAHRHAARHEPTWPLEHPDLSAQVLRDGRLPPRDADDTRFVAYFAHPDEVVPLCRGAGLEVVTVLGLEGLVSLMEEGVNALEGAAWEAWVDLNWQVAPDPSLHGGVEHLLAVTRKPLWRAVLRRVAQRLTEAGVTYKVVGGTAAALHGIPVTVNDLDLETDAEGAYRFQSMFAEQALLPFSWRESETYRSHFGRFDFGGVVMEVMGELQRREGDEWVPTQTLTETTVALDGVSVRVPWLEEEVLAYLRRGRLVRAAKCLPHCDHARLLALLRGDLPVDVL